MKTVSDLHPKAMDLAEEAFRLRAKNQHKRALELREPTWVQPRSMHEDPVRNETDGHLFNVISHGIRSMPAYGYKVPAADRWAIVLYVRALQLSRNAPLDAVPAGARGNLQQK